MQNYRRLFEITKGGKRLAVGVRGAYGGRTYLGFIDGQIRATAPAKGEVMRLLLQMASGLPTG